MLYTIHYDSPIGRLLLAATDRALTGAWILGQKYFPDLQPDAVQEGENPILKQTVEWLERYFAGRRPVVSELPLAPAGSAFRQEVWKLLCEIPYGEVTTYGDIAKKMAARQGKSTMSSQAVGGAVGHNPISIIIPCHRVVGANGSLTGYAGGLQTKIQLLTLEGADMTRLFVPAKGTAL